ncbi:MAG: PIN domain-containing protein [Thiotrichales bacterium]|nr:PIN domain-containing protein [Thiotrichales bacterium]
MSLFVDTSALLTFLDADQPRHADVIDAWERAIAGDRHLFTSNYVLVESFALVQRRLGLDALRALADILVPLLRPLWIDEDLHAAAVAALFAASRRKLSLVDCTSFELMRRHGLTEALALDDDFARQGFGLLPGPSSPRPQPASAG